jgi:hypothetical protein
VRKMLAKFFRCKLVATHDWRALRIDGEQAWECRICGERYAGTQPPLWGSGPAVG